MTTKPVITAHDAGLVGCTMCGNVAPAGTPTCEHCGSTLNPVTIQSLQKVWAWWAAGLICYIPANLYPMLHTKTLLGDYTNTIVGGVIELAQMGSWAVALIVFSASVVIPMSKFICIAYLSISVATGQGPREHGRLRLYEIVDFIGRWSMIDVFVVAILSSLVQLGFVASIHPGGAAVAFCLSVAFTMRAAQCFDPRLIWRNPVPAETSHSGQPAMPASNRVNNDRSI